MMAIGLSMRKAATENTTFTVLPLPILKLEKEGFRQFAKWHAGMSVEWETIAIGRDSCSLCNVAIGAGDRYTRVEIREEIENTKGIETKDGHTLAILCESCAENYLVWVPMSPSQKGY